MTYTMTCKGCPEKQHGLMCNNTSCAVFCLKTLKQEEKKRKQKQGR